LKKTNFIFVVILLAGISLNSQTDYAARVNPFIGTGGTGHTFPGAVLPFGMVQLSPDTRIDGSWEGCSGYYYPDSVIYGFSHTHLSGTGVSDYGDILLMPTTGEASLKNKDYSSHFSHLKEKATPGFYQVHLDDDHIDAELTTTTRVGIHRYTFPKTDKANVIIDLLHRDKTMHSNITIIDSVTIIGYRVSEAWAREQYVYFALKFSKPFKKSGLSTMQEGVKFPQTKKTEKTEGGFSSLILRMACL
jgi:putative alpha-1,2-mannosidase